VIDNFTAAAVELWCVADDDDPHDGPQLALVLGWSLAEDGALWPVVSPIGADGELIGCAFVWVHRPRLGRRLTFHLSLRAAEQRARELDHPRTVVDLDDVNPRRSTS
jgi:hypothetical protein